MQSVAAAAVRPNDRAASESTDDSDEDVLLLPVAGADSPLSVQVPPLPTPPVTPVAQGKSFGIGQVAWVSVASPSQEVENQDAAAAVECPGLQGVLLVADGLGGHRGGRRASQLVKTSFSKFPRKLENGVKEFKLGGIVPVPLKPARKNDGQLRALILDEIEKINHRILRSRSGAGTTLAMVEVNGNRVRTYHIGDSEILILSARGRVKYSSIPHSPIGFALESGMLTEEQALRHPDRHLVSNVLGNEHMSIELGSWITLAPRDTVLLGSDGLFDNLRQHEIIECVRKGKLVESVSQLAKMAWQRMLNAEANSPSKPDDLTILAFRPSR